MARDRQQYLFDHLWQFRPRACHERQRERLQRLQRRLEADRPWLDLNGESLKMPSAEPLPIVGSRCGALRVRDAQHSWRIMYRVDETVVLVVDVYDKKTQQIPDQVIDRSKKRLHTYDEKRKAAQS